MTNMYNGYHLLPIINFINNAVIANSNPPGWAITQLKTARGAWLTSKVTNNVTNSLVSTGWQLS